MREKCYKLHGFPQNFKFTKGKNASATNVHGVPDEIFGRNCATSDLQTTSQGIQNLTKEQYGQLLSLLENFQVGNTGEGSKNMIIRAANLADILACYTSITEIGDLSCNVSN